MQKTVAAIILVLMLLIASCSSGDTPQPPTPEPPEVEAQTVEPTKAPTPTSIPTSTPVPLPPIVLRTSPEVGQEQSLDAPIEITFDQPMDRDSVEKAFAIEPGASVDGTPRSTTHAAPALSTAVGMEFPGPTRLTGSGIYDTSLT